MPNFPTTENDVRILVNRLYNGYYYHKTDFPHLGIYMYSLSRIYRYYIQAKDALINAKSKEKLAEKTKENSLNALKETMKNCLKQAEVDSTNNPQNLKLIGWDIKSSPQPVTVPNPPTDLQITKDDNGTLKLRWNRPAGGAKVRNYIIERRHKTPDRGISDWTIINSSYRTQTILRNQPIGIKLEFQVKAVNLAGQSLPSNTVTVVL